MFDPAKPYGKIYGSCGNARFEQGGKLYDREHREVRLIETHVRDDYGVLSVVTTTELVRPQRHEADPSPEPLAQDEAGQATSEDAEPPKKRGRPASTVSK